MYKYQLIGKAYPESFHVPIEAHKINTEILGIKNEFTMLIDNENVVNCIVYSNHQWDPHDLLNHAELLVQNTLNSIAFFTGITTEIFFNHIECSEIGMQLELKMDYQTEVAHGVPPDFLSQSSLLLKLCETEYGWHLTRSINEYRLALRHPMDGGFFCFRSIECLRIYCKYRFDISREKHQWEKLRTIAGVDRKKIDSIKSFADSNRHGDYQGISSNDRVEILHSTRNIIHCFFHGIFNGDSKSA